MQSINAIFIHSEFGRFLCSNLHGAELYQKLQKMGLNAPLSDIQY